MARRGSSSPQWAGSSPGVSGARATSEQVQLFLAKAREVVPRFYVLFLLLMRTGLRINEALALRVKDVDLSTRQLRVEHEKVRNKDGRWVLGPPKSEYGVRTVRVTAQLVFELRRCLEVDRAKAKLRHGWKDSPPWLFYADVDPASYDPSDDAAGTLDDGNVRRQMRRVLTALPADFPKWFTPHSGRHTFASQLLAEGERPVLRARAARARVDQADG